MLNCIFATFAGDVYVKGLEKVRWLSAYNGTGVPIMDLADMGWPSFINLRQIGVESCLMRRKVCALRNAYMLYFWIHHNRFLSTIPPPPSEEPFFPDDDDDDDDATVGNASESAAPVTSL